MLCWAGLDASILEDFSLLSQSEILQLDLQSNTKTTFQVVADISTWKMLKVLDFGLWIKPSTFITDCCLLVSHVTHISS